MPTGFGATPTSLSFTATLSLSACTRKSPRHRAPRIPASPTQSVLTRLAHLGLARAYALSGDTAKAKTAYNDFFTLWKDADPDIPILIAAKSEYTNLN